MESFQVFKKDMNIREKSNCVCNFVRLKGKLRLGIYRFRERVK